MAAHRAVKVGWRAKALAFNIFDRVPFGEKLYYFVQKNVTHTLPRKLSPTAVTGNVQLRHMRAVTRYRNDLDKITLMEFGAGWDLYANLIYYCMGVDRQIAIDIRRWARAESINAVIAHLQSDPPAGHVRLPSIPVRQDHLEEDLKAAYGIRYLAPFDARDTGFADGSVDLILTTSVLEHIPAEVCRAIMTECRRVIRPDGLVSHAIDYSDHYAHADPGITCYNYLRFDDREWEAFSPGIHYQNRLRTADFKALFDATGFQVLEAVEWRGLEEEFTSTTIHPKFSKLDREALMALGCYFVLRPA